MNGLINKHNKQLC